MASGSTLVSFSVRQSESRVCARVIRANLFLLVLFLLFHAGRLPHRKPPASVPDTLDQLVPQQQALAAVQQTLWRSMMPRKLPVSAVAQQQQQQCHRSSSRSGKLAAAAERAQNLQSPGDSEACKKVACSGLLRPAVLEACRNGDAYQQQQQKQHQAFGGAGGRSKEKAVSEEMLDPAAYVQPKQQQQHQSCDAAGSWSEQKVVNEELVDLDAYCQPKQQQQQHQTSGPTGSWSGQKFITEELVDPAAYAMSRQQQGQQQHKALPQMHLIGQQQRQEHQQWLGDSAFAIQQAETNTLWQHCNSSSGNGFGDSTLLGHDTEMSTKAAAATGRHCDTTPIHNGTVKLARPAAVLQQSYRQGAKPAITGVANSTACAGIYGEGSCKPAVGQGHCAMVCGISATQFAAVDFEDCDAMLSNLAALME